ncbi:MAG: hypothetical protein R3D01_02690 [Hyphomicrobiales bacterium]
MTLAKQKEMGIVPPTLVTSELSEGIAAWRFLDDDQRKCSPL